MMRIPKVIEKLNGVIRDASVFKASLLICLLSILVKLPSSWFGDWLMYVFNINNPIFDSDNQIYTLGFVDNFSALVVAPLFETLVGQYVPIKIIGRFTKSRNLIIVLSAFTFSLWHLPVVGFLISAFVIGLVFSWAYLVRLEMPAGRPFTTIALAHFMHNLVAVLFLALYVIAGVEI